MTPEEIKRERARQCNIRFQERKKDKVRKESQKAAGLHRQIIFGDYADELV